MKAIILVSIALSFTVQAGSIEKCKEVGKLAQAVMEYRQNKPDVFEALQYKKFSGHDNMVLAAYERPRYDSMKTLSASISDYMNTSLKIHHDKTEAKRKNEVSLFKMKYIKKCLAGIK